MALLSGYGKDSWTVHAAPPWVKSFHAMDTFDLGICGAFNTRGWCHVPNHRQVIDLIK